MREGRVKEVVKEEKEKGKEGDERERRKGGGR